MLLLKHLLLAVADALVGVRVDLLLQLGALKQQLLRLALRTHCLLKLVLLDQLPLRLALLLCLLPQLLLPELLLPISFLFLASFLLALSRAPLAQFILYCSVAGRFPSGSRLGSILLHAESPIQFLKLLVLRIDPSYARTLSPTFGFLEFREQLFLLVLQRNVVFIGRYVRLDLISVDLRDCPLQLLRKSNDEAAAVPGPHP